jgi:cbb3-type cytochrome oxidase maturation protein
MTGLAFLIPIALGMGLLGLAAFFWSMKDGQYDDMEGAANRILIDDESLGEDEV